MKNNDREIARRLELIQFEIDKHNRIESLKWVADQWVEVYWSRYAYFLRNGVE